MIFLIDGLDARLRNGHIEHKKYLLMMGNHFDTGRMLELTMFYKANVDFTNIQDLYLLLQAPCKCPANHLISIIFEKGAKGMKVFSMMQ